MQQPLINILIRTSNRPQLFARCLYSILCQSYKNIRIIVSIDNPHCNYVPQWIDTIEVEKQLGEYGYDLYCNELKREVDDGYFFYLDDDDTLAPDCLSQLRLFRPAILCQLNHMGNILPTSADVLPGRVGMPCLILHHSLKNIADIPGEDHNDYWWIKKVSDNVKLDFQPVVVVVSDRKGMGQPA